jgi:hypothetical protein
LVSFCTPTSFAHSLFFFKTAEGQKKENNKRMDGQWVFSLLPPFFPNSKTYSFSLPSLGVGQIHIHSFHWPNHSTAIATSLAAGSSGEWKKTFSIQPRGGGESFFMAGKIGWIGHRVEEGDFPSIFSFILCAAPRVFVWG